MEAEQSTVKSIKAEIDEVKFDIEETERQIEKLKKEDNTIALQSKLATLEDHKERQRALDKDYNNAIMMVCV